MGMMTVKPVQDVDLYVIFSSQEDLPVAFGTAEELLREFVKDQFRNKYTRTNLFGERYWEALEHADNTSCSSRFLGSWSWEEDEEIWWGRHGTLRRSQLVDVVKILDENDFNVEDPRILEILTPIEDDFDEDEDEVI